MRIAIAGKHAVLFLSLALIVLILGAPTANACSCGRTPTVLEEYEPSNIVVIAEVISVEKSSESERSVDGVRSTKMVVEKVLKGAIQPGEEMVFRQGGGGDCIWTFNEEDIGERYLFYLSTRRKGEKLWSAYYCGRSTNTKSAADDLLYLENQSKLRGKTRLSGTLSYYQNSAVEDQQPIYNTLAGKKVKIIGEKKSYELVTNQDGVYEIYDLPAGKYVIDPEVPNGWKIDHKSVSASPRQSDDKENDTSAKPLFQVFLEAGKHAYFDFGYGVNNAIRGRVLDPVGNVMKDVCLRLLPAQGKPSGYFSESDCTKKDGAFEIVGIPPGRYVISVNNRGKISSSEPFPTFYYPNVFEREKAGIVTVTEGHLIEGIDIYVPRMEETIIVEGVVRHSDGRPVSEERVLFEPKNTSDEIDGKARAETDATGRFAIKVLKGLEGTLYAEVVAYVGEYEDCPKLEALIKQSGRDVAIIRTNIVAIRAEDNVTNVELRYSFPSCKKARQGIR